MLVGTQFSSLSSLHCLYSSQCLSLQDPSPDVYSPPGTARARAPFSPPGSPSRGVPGADRTPSRSSLKRPVSVPVSVPVAADVVTVHPADPVAGAAVGSGAGATVRFGGADEMAENEGRRTPVRSRVQVPPLSLRSLSLPVVSCRSRCLIPRAAIRPPSRCPRYPLSCHSCQSPLLMGVPRSFLVGAEDGALPCTLR